MSTKEKELKGELINRISNLSEEKLKSLEEFIDSLEKVNSSKERILSFAGIFKNLDDEIYGDLTENLHMNRLKGNNRII